MPLSYWRRWKCVIKVRQRRKKKAGVKKLSGNTVQTWEQHVVRSVFLPRAVRLQTRCSLAHSRHFCPTSNAAVTRSELRIRTHQLHLPACLICLHKGNSVPNSRGWFAKIKFLEQTRCPQMSHTDSGTENLKGTGPNLWHPRTYFLLQWPGWKCWTTLKGLSPFLYVSLKCCKWSRCCVMWALKIADGSDPNQPDNFIPRAWLLLFVSHFISPTCVKRCLLCCQTRRNRCTRRWNN